MTILIRHRNENEKELDDDRPTANCYIFFQPENVFGPELQYFRPNFMMYISHFCFIRKIVWSFHRNERTSAQGLGIVCFV